MSSKIVQRRILAVALAALMALTALAQPSLGDPQSTAPGNAVPGSPCPVQAPRREYNVTSMPLPISYNHWGDFDPLGRLFVPQTIQSAMLDDVGAKLTVAGLGSLADPLADMRAALAAGDTEAATAAAARLVDAGSALDTSEPPRDRFDQSDLVQPLVLRAHVGDCITIRLTNLLPEATSIHTHAVVAPPGAGEAVGVQQADFAFPGQTRLYRMYIPPWPGMEGAHFLHSHVDSRYQTRHGLFGAVVAEPLGSSWVSMADGTTPAPIGLEAIIVMPGAPDFREFVKIYHDETELVDWRLEALPAISPYGEYGPGTKSISFRTEPFMDRFKFHDSLAFGLPNEPGSRELPRNHDKSQSYGSYTYGDPSTWIQRSYLGDPVKFRMINAGPGQHHIHHLHGGGIRWRSTPMAEPSQIADGLIKDEANGAASASQRLDVQNAGPGESFNLEPEGGTGGVQQSAGDFLYHCHIAEHYLAGMWGIWRAYNTLQADLAPLPDRVGLIRAAVTSAELVGTTVRGGNEITSANIDAWVQQFLPAKGVPGEEDASVWNWAVDTTDPSRPVYLGEPETAWVWPTFKADAPGRLPAGERPEIGFDPISGKPAYPMLRPHLGARPPFAPNHGGSPYLTHDTTTAMPDGLCPGGSPGRKYDVVAIQANATKGIKYNAFDKDASGQVFTLAQDRAAIDSGQVNPTSIVLRANAGDCIDVTLTSALKEKGTGEANTGVHTKTNIHIHLVQFDVQGSDGVVAGYNYETTLRSLNGSYKAKNVFATNDPSVQVNTQIASGGVTTVNGQSVIAVASTKPFLDKLGNVKVGSTVGFGLGATTIESAKLVAVDTVAKTITVDRVLTHAHAAQEWVGYEFVRYQWYPDVELGTVYFHDHVNGLDTWRHGLFGSLIVEPKGTKWMSPKRLDDSAPDDPTSHIVDVIKPGTNATSGRAFREIVLHFQDRACVSGTTADDCLDHAVPAMPDRVKEPAGFNLRSEPLHRRNAQDPFWSSATWSKNEPSTPANELLLPQGDPSTDILEAYPGDDVVIRFLYTGQSMSRAVGTFGVTGHRFRAEQYLEGSRTTDAMSAAVSSQHNFEFECGAGGCTRQPGDYMYLMTQPEYLDRGAWGLIRVHEPSDLSKIRVLPNNDAPTVGGVPAGTPVRRYNVSAVETLVTHNPNLGLFSTMRRFVTDDQLPVDLTQPPSLPFTATLAVTPPDPLVIRASAGELVEVQLTNRMPTGRVGLHAAMVSAGPGDQGFNVGRGPAQTVGPNGSIVYRWYADRELGVADLVSYADPVHDATLGLTGALVIEPAGRPFRPATGPRAEIDLGNGLVAVEHVLLFASPDAQFESSTMPYVPDVAGLTLVNYATEPLARRMGALVPAAAGLPPVSGAGISTCHVDTANCLERPMEARDPAMMLATSGLAPWTPIIEVGQGQPLIIRAVGASGDQLAVFHVDGHQFAMDPEMDDCRNVLATCDSNIVSSATIGAREVRNIWIPAAGLGGPGDYLYRNHRDAYFEAGAWGMLRVIADTPVVPPVS